ncbi:cation transporter [Sphingomonas alpina]|uniref:Cation transporter n=1 Tax=Sphingomonas alpina TaxID=653931 RepID=A0A7H0LFF6_9SPHN|nr:cation transporter [Sphingomonas alpina]QNQ08409.1 cation transporter [Sphingomonas alpina]
MACNSCANQKPANDPRWRRVLWIALIVNATMFAIELVVGATAESRALQADALDFFGDSASYAISLVVAGMALRWRARAAFAKGATLTVLGAWVLVTAGWAALAGASPQAVPMGVIGVMALIANGGVAALLYRYRQGDANMRSVWICSRNDAIGNVAVVLAAGGVFGTGTMWPDLIVATILAVLGLSGGAQIMRQARQELRADRASDGSIASHHGAIAASE